MKPFYPILALLPFLFVFLLGLTPSSSTDPYYYNCTNPKSKTCGDGQLISFPFFIQNQQDSFCGLPGFNLTCNSKGQPILNLGQTNLVIRKINYSSHSIRVVNDAVSDTNSSSSSSSSCLPPMQNMSIPVEKFNFPYSNQPHDLFLLYNCNSSDKLTKYELNCSSGTNRSTLAVFDDDPLLGFASSQCKKAVEVPVEREGGEAAAELVRRGFVLNWVGSNCSECEESGGRCGFDSAAYFVKCFCPDRPHALHCKG